MKGYFIASLFLCAIKLDAQLAVLVASPKVAGQRAVVPLTFRNHFSEKIESARAVVFLLDEQGKTVGHPATRWVIGNGNGTDTLALNPGATNTFHFVISSDKPFTTTNLTAKVSFSRVVLEGGKLADVTKDVSVRDAAK